MAILDVDEKFALISSVYDEAARLTPEERDLLLGTVITVLSGGIEFEKLPQEMQDIYTRAQESGLLDGMLKIVDMVDERGPELQALFEEAEELSNTTPVQ